MIKIDIAYRAERAGFQDLQGGVLLPAKGDHMSSDKDGFSGYVHGTMFWWWG